LYQRSKNEIRALTYENCFINDVFRSREQFQELGIFLTGTLHLRLQSAVLHAKKKYSKKSSIKKEKTVATFLKSFKKGSKKFRSCFDANRIAENNILELHTVQTYTALVDTPIEDPDPVAFAI
jgi:hypothetical protein